MNKLNLIPKKIKQRFLSINDSLENYFSKLNFIKSYSKKNNILANNRVFFGISAVLILTLSYFLLPTLYNKNIVQVEIKNQILKKYNINVKFNENIRYGLLPKPHFISKNLSILNDEREIGIVKSFKIFIDFGNFFSIDNLEVKDLVLNKTDFNLNKKDFLFFDKLLKMEPNENRIIFKKSNIFFKNLDEELLFLNKINISKFYFDSYNLENVLISKNEIFNIPYTLNLKNNKFRKNFFIKFNSRKIRLDIENNTNYDDELKKGKVDLLFVNKNESLSYEINKNSLKFSSIGKKKFNGYFDFKPFYLKATFNYEGISAKDILKNDSVLVELFKSEILNNQNLNVNIDLNVNNITNIDYLNDLKLKLNLDQGDITFSKSRIMWKDDLEINLKEGLLNYNQNEIFLIGKLIINANNIDNFYKSFQIKKIYRKKMNKLELDFVYNFNKNKFIFDNVKIDNKSNDKLNKFLDNFNSTDKKFFNKIVFKNFINNFFSNYEG
tara:strand:- start:507 stop:1994 length:1488 start_codon:yes stop_codon:yes gene_type:complete